MALSLFVGRGSAGEDPFDSLLFDSLAFPSFSSSLRASFPEHPSFARDVAAVANTQVDWKETPDSHIFKANLPGLAKEDVKVQVEDGRVLQISGERKKEETASSDRWHRVERAQGSFLRRFRLPDDAKEGGGGEGGHGQRRAHRHRPQSASAGAQVCQQKCPDLGLMVVKSPSHPVGSL